MTQFIQTRFDAAVATVTLSRPPVNAMSLAWIAEFGAALDQAMDHGANVLCIRSDQRVFSAGADIEEIRQGIESPAEGGAAKIARALQALFLRLEQAPLISLAEISGGAFGGGLELALSCDLRVAANEAQLGLPEARLGLIPGAGGTQRLTRLCGPGIAARIILGAEIVTGAEARHLGLVQWAAPKDELAARTDAIVRSLAALSGSALREAKHCMAAAGNARRNGFDEEITATERLLADPQTRIRVNAFFANRKPPSPKGQV